MKTEPLRISLYPLLAMIVAYLVGRGIIDAALGEIIVAAVVLTLGIFGVEVARSNVSPVQQ